MEDDGTISRAQIGLGVLVPQAVDSGRRRASLPALSPSSATFPMQATNIAETSITINGIRFVVDSGKVKVSQDPPLPLPSTFSSLPPITSPYTSGTLVSRVGFDERLERLSGCAVPGGSGGGESSRNPRGVFIGAWPCGTRRHGCRSPIPRYRSDGPRLRSSIRVAWGGRFGRSIC